MNSLIEKKPVWQLDVLYEENNDQNFSTEKVKCHVFNRK